MWCNQTAEILQNSTLSALVCSASQDASLNSTCTAICPNQDLSGIGVRSAFYLQSFMNTLLVIFSRRDSVPSTWAGTLLTGALVIAAMVQKANQTITLHHAILTMNFATLSCISSLAVAPTLPIWRLTPREYYAKQIAHNIVDDDDPIAQQRLVNAAVDEIAGKHRKRIERAQGRQRVFLALALLTQVVLQWAWGVVLFVSPSYGQKNCSGNTKLRFFLKSFTAHEINERYMFVWVLWLLFSLGITMFMTIVLALTSPTRARSTTLRSSPASSVNTRLSSAPSTSGANTPVYLQLIYSAYNAIPEWKDKTRQLIFWYDIGCIILWAIYIAASEIQIQSNCIFAGENDVTSFGQITALLLSLAPLWSLVVALYKWPELQRRLERRRRREQLGFRHAASFTGAPSPASPLARRLLAAASDSGSDGHLSDTYPAPAPAAQQVVAVALPTRDTAPPSTAPTVAVAATNVNLAPRARPRARRAHRASPSSGGHAFTASPTLDGVHLVRSSTGDFTQELLEMGVLSRARDASL